MKIITILGARPQFIKAASVSREIIKRAQSINISEIIIHTGQHYDERMSDIFFRELDIPQPKYNLQVGSGLHGFQTGRMLEGIEQILVDENPDIVQVYGDTNSTLAGALAASKLHIPIAHVEAGLRSFNRYMPEEINRIMTDHLSSLLLCPTETAVNNLVKEGIINNVFNVGDVMQDASYHAIQSQSVDIIKKMKLSKDGFIMMTVHRAENTDNHNILKEILSAVRKMNNKVIWPIHPRTKSVILNMNLAIPSNLIVIEPLSYFENIVMLSNARILLTDSGGMQKEAYWLGIPCVTLREQTEWIETVKVGWNKLSGTSSERILESINDFKKPLEKPDVLGKLGASIKVVDLLIESMINK